jgi:hypothetical protein
MLFRPAREGKEMLVRTRSPDPRLPAALRTFRRGHGTVRASSAALVLAAATATAHATHFTATWKPNTTGNWDNVANWNNTPVFPNNGGGNDFDAILNEPAGNCTLNVPITVTGWTLGAGTMSGNGIGSLGVVSAGTWSGGALVGAGTIVLNNATFLLNGGTHALAQFNLVTGAGAATSWSAGPIVGVGAQGAVFANSGTFNDSTDDGWTWSANQTPVFNNLASGHYEKTAGTLNSFKELQAAFNNSGVVDVTAAELWLKGGGVSGGTFNVASGATLLLSDFNEARAAAGAPVTTLLPSSVVNSVGFVDFPNSGGNAHSDVMGTFDSDATVISPGASGVVRFLSGARVSNHIVGDWFADSGTVQFTTGQVDGIVMQRLILSGGLIAGTDNVRVLTNFNWSAGALSGFRTTFAQGGILIFNTGLKRLVDHTLINQTGIASWTGGSISLSNSTIYNEPQALFDLQFDASMFNSDPAQQSAFVNRGGFIKSGGAGVASVQDISFYNVGTVDVRSGTLRLAGGGVHDGAFLVASAATLQFQSTGFANNDPNHRFHATAVVGNGAGTLQLLGVSTFDLGSQVNVADLRIEGMISESANISSNSGRIVGGGVANLNGGSWANSGSISVGGAGNGTLNVNSPAHVTSGQINVGTGGWVQVNGGTISTSALTLSSGGNATLAPAGFNLLDIGAANIDTAAASKLDLNDNDARLTASSYATAAGYVAFARNGGAWDRGGITSTAARVRPNHNTTLGVMSGAEYRGVYGPAATFDGVLVNTTDTLIKYTYYGDADFNGKVNFDDYVRIDAGFNEHRTGWFNGDFDLNGVVNFDDYVLIDLAFNTQSGTLRPALSFLDGSDRRLAGMSDPALREVGEHFTQFGNDYAQHFLAAVPEPAFVACSLSLLAVAAIRRHSGRRRR